MLGVYTSNPSKTSALIRQATILDYGLSVARDLGEADPERMTPKRVEEYVLSIFKESSVTVSVVSDENQLQKEYPLFAAVNRAASVVERHKGRIIFLEYNPPDPSKVQKTLLLVGKGVTYDTGGADIKAGGIMAGMSRDKCGAAAVAGFLAIVDSLKPENVRVIAGLSMVRNSVGSNAYVSDEVITSRAGVRVRIRNTDAEGRMVMTDVLCRVSIICQHCHHSLHAVLILILLLIHTYLVSKTETKSIQQIKPNVFCVNLSSRSHAFGAATTKIQRIFLRRVRFDGARK